ncbi:MAG TPA: IS630 family transposase [Ktedonobacteraceae bacterium]|nr:IS630 family transposase [Ktedonobacteraceae bacterium]
MKAYSQDLRERIVQTVDERKTQAETAHLFKVSLKTVERYIRQRREKGHLLPKPIPGRPPTKRAVLEAKLQPQLEKKPDATLQEHCKAFETETGIKVSISTMSRAIDHLQWTFKKKTLQASERKEEEREIWRGKAKDSDASKYRFIDEMGSNLSLTRFYARAPKGKRAYGTIVRKRGKNVTMITDLSLHGLGEKFIIDGAANADLFEAYIEQVLAPTLSSGEIVVMDNCPIHKRQKVRELIEARGCQLQFLPTYSPDLSPIEEAFSKVKAILRGIGARTREDLQEALEYAITTVTASDASGWFWHCGYQVPDPHKQKVA